MQRAAKLIVLAVGFGLVVPAAAAPPVSFPPGTDLDSNGAHETEYSALSQEFIVPASGGRIGFDWQLFTSEFFGGAAEDVFYVRLIDADTGTVIDEVNGALNPTPSGYSGTFTPIDAPPMGTTGSSHAPPGLPGLTFGAFHIDGGTGWMTSDLSIAPAASDHWVALEILVADTFDRNADTSLAVDRLIALDVTGAPIPSLANPDFESELSDWTTEGNVGIYSGLDSMLSGGPEPGTGPTQGDRYALISTAGAIPEPSSLWLLGSAIIAFVYGARWPRRTNR